MSIKQYIKQNYLQAQNMNNLKPYKNTNPNKTLIKISIKIKKIKIQIKYNTNRLILIIFCPHRKFNLMPSFL